MLVAIAVVVATLLWLVVDRDDVAPITRVEIGGRPAAITVGGGSVWVVDDERNVVVRLDEGTGRPAGEPIGIPRLAVAADYGRGGVWVAHANGFVTVVDARSLRVSAPIPVGGAPVGITVAGPAVWVADIERSVLVPIDVETRAPGATVAVPEGAVRVEPERGRLWVSNLERTVTPVDVATREAGSPVDVGRTPIGLAVDARGTLWVANSEDDTVSRLARGGSVETIEVGDAPVGVAPVGDVLWVANQDGRSLTPVSLSTGRVLRAALDLGARPRGIAAGGRHVWVAGTDPGVVVRVARSAAG